MVGPGAITADASMSTCPEVRPRPLIFVVDDDAVVRSALLLLFGTRGWSVHAFAGGRAVLTTLATLPTRPACIVLDLLMPDLDGMLLQQRLQALVPDTPSIILTGAPDSAQARRALAAGARAVLAKPPDPEQLLASIEQVLLQG